jgi:hypothetical protein
MMPDPSKILPSPSALIQSKKNFSAVNRMLLSPSSFSSFTSKDDRSIVAGTSNSSRIVNDKTVQMLPLEDSLLDDGNELLYGMDPGCIIEDGFASSVLPDKIPENPYSGRRKWDIPAKNSENKQPSG